MNLENLNLVGLNAQETYTVNGGNGIHSAGYSNADMESTGHFYWGIISGVYHKIFG